MKITNIRLRQIEGTMRFSGTLLEERLRQPTDIYPKFKALTAPEVHTHWTATPMGDDRYKVSRTFLQVETDEGISGIAGPITSVAAAFYIDTQLRPLLIGQDPMATELLWDQMYRNAIHGRKGDNMHAKSLIYTARLWNPLTQLSRLSSQ